MGLFENIVENVLCEISANDAYEKFYSKIPKETFDKIVNAYGGKFDGFIKLLLSGIVDGSLTNINIIFYCIKEYKALENKVRIYISNKIKNKEYSDAIELFYEIKKAAEGNIQIVSPKELYTNGLVNVAENETWKITCTLNYQASHHFYGNSKWCTASDRLGRYDGFEYFSKYITDLMGEWNDDEWNEPYIKAKCCLVQFVNKQDISETMQAQIKSNGNLETICNFNDDEIYEEDFMSIFGVESNTEIFIELKKQIPNLISLTNEQRTIELKYESSRNDYVYAKRDEIERRRDEIYSQKRDEANRLNNEQHNEVMKCFNDVIENKLFLNVDFLNSLYFKHDDDIFERIEYFEDQICNGINVSETENFKSLYKIIKDSKFLMKNSINELSPNSEYSILKLETVIGLEYLALDIEQPRVAVNLSTYRCNKENGYIYILVKSKDGSNIDSIIKVLSRGKSNNENIPEIVPLRTVLDDLDDRFNDYILYRIWTNYDEDGDYKIISLTNNKSVSLGLDTNIKSGKTYIFEDSKEFMIMYWGTMHHINLDTYKYERIEDFEIYNGTMNVYITQDATVFYTKGQYIYKNEDFKNKNIRTDSILYIYYGAFKVIADKKIYIYTLPNLKKPIFECKSLFSIDYEKIVFLPTIDSHQTQEPYSNLLKKVIYMRQGNYFCYRSNNGEFITCDMYGKDINQSQSINESFKKMKELYNKIID